MKEPTPEQAIELYAAHVRNLRAPDSSGIDELLVLATRTAIEGSSWTPEQRKQVDQLDEKLASHWRVFKGTLPHPAEHPRAQWWWFLHEGPQVLEEARKMRV